MLWGGSNGGLEVRTLADGATRLRGRFAYGDETTLSGNRREVFASRAFSAKLEAGDDVHLLVGHDFDRPLASRAAGSLTLIDGDTALTFEATIAPELRAVTHVQDFLGTLAAGLVKGLSPGFRVPAGGDVVQRDGNVLLRTVRSAELVEISAVTKPAYPAAQIEARCWTPDQVAPRNINAAYRWRA